MKQEETPEQKKERETVEEIACGIAKLGRQVSALLSGRLKRETIVLLLAHTTKISKGDVSKVLSAIESMEKDHLKKGE